MSTLSFTYTLWKKDIDNPPIVTKDITRTEPNRTNITITQKDFLNTWNDADGHTLQAIRVEGSPSDIARLKLNGVVQSGTSFDITNVSNFAIEYTAKDEDNKTTTEYDFKVKTNGVWSN